MRQLLVAFVFFIYGLAIGVQLMSSSSTAIAGGRPALLHATGQTMCYDQSGEEIPCDDTSYPGQDGFYQTGCPMESRFIDNMDGTVTDLCTGLMWQRDSADTNADGEANELDRLPWDKALAYCEDLTFGGYGDWRLPNVVELLSIRDYGRRTSIDPIFGGPPAQYWSSTTFADPASAWPIAFGTGLEHSDYPKSNLHNVRAVRKRP